MKKRGLALLMALALTLSLAACGGTEETPDDTADAAEEETIPSGGEADLAEEETPEETPEEDGTTVTIDEIEKEETDEPEMGSGTADPAQKPQTGTAPADPNKTSDAKPVQEPPSAPQEPASGSGTDAQPPAEETAGGTEPETPAEGTDTSAVDLAAFAASVTSDQETWPGMMAMEGESLDMFYAGLSGIATGASWLCYYRALQDGLASVVVPIDKLSILVTVAFSSLVFHERLTARSGAGLLLIVAGTLAMLL